jgi:tRNA1Val (adenine37-N6)-methyltransferase
MSEVLVTPASSCWRCNGAGSRLAKLSGVVSPVPCVVCKGSGVLSRTPARDVRASPRPRKGFPGWVEVGPSTAALPDGLDAHEELCSLTGRWRILQRTDSHRYSTDDLVTAWVGWRAGCARAAAGSTGAGVRAAADIGCGLGSVLLVTAWMHPHAVCVGAEAQDARASLAARSAALNGLLSRVSVVRGDLRAPTTLAALESTAAALLGTAAAGSGARGFDLVTGTPPYFDAATGGARPPHEESARCLFEYRGGIEAYCASARRLLAPDGIFCVCESSLALNRGYAAAEAAELRVLARVDVVPRAGKPPLFFVLVCERNDAPNDARARSAWVADFLSDDAQRSRLPYEDMRGDAYEGAFGAVRAAARARSAAAADERRGAGLPADKQSARGAHVDAAGKPLLTEAEAVRVVVVRDEFGERTDDFARILWHLGKPS